MKNNRVTLEKIESESPGTYFSTFYSKSKNYTIRQESSSLSFTMDKKVGVKARSKLNSRPPDLLKSPEGPYELRSPRESYKSMTDKNIERKAISASLSGKVLEPIRPFNEQLGLRQASSDRSNNLRYLTTESESEKSEDKAHLLSDILRSNKAKRSGLGNADVVTQTGAVNMINNLNKTTLGFSRPTNANNNINADEADANQASVSSSKQRTQTSPVPNETSLTVKQTKAAREEGSAGFLLNEFNFSGKNSSSDHFVRTLPYYSYSLKNKPVPETDKRSFRELMLESASIINSGRKLEPEGFDLNSRGISLPNLFERQQAGKGKKVAAAENMIIQENSNFSKKMKDFIVDLHKDKNTELNEVINNIHTYFVGSLAQQSKGSGESHLDVNLNMIERLKKVKASNVLASSFGEQNPAASNNDPPGEPSESSEHVSIYIKKLVESLKKEVRNPYSNVPAGRQEVLALREWFLKTLQGISSECGFDRKEKLILADEVFNICLQEIIRQICYHCFERGELLLIIWDNYIDLFRKVFQSERELIGRLKHESEEVLQSAIVQHDSKLRMKLSDIKERDIEIVDLREQIQQTKEALNVSRTREMDLDKKIGLLRDALRRMKVEARNALNENLLLKEKINLQEITIMEMKRKNGKYFNEPEGKGVTEEGASSPEEEKKSNSDEAESAEEEMDKDLQELLGMGPEDQKNNKVNSGKNWESINNVVIKYIGKNDLEKVMFSESTEIDFDIIRRSTSNEFCQTDLFLVDKKYDTLMKSNEVFEDAVQEFTIKKEIIDFTDTNLKRSTSTSPRKSFRQTPDGEFNIIMNNPQGVEDTPRKKSLLASGDQQNLKPRKSIIKFLEEGLIYPEGVSPRSPLTPHSPRESLPKINMIKIEGKQESAKDVKAATTLMINFNPAKEENKRTGPRTNETEPRVGSKPGKKVTEKEIPSIEGRFQPNKALEKRESKEDAESKEDSASSEEDSAKEKAGQKTSAERRSSQKKYVEGMMETINEEKETGSSPLVPIRKLNSLGKKQTSELQKPHSPKTEVRTNGEKIKANGGENQITEASGSVIKTSKDPASPAKKRLLSKQFSLMEEKEVKSSFYRNSSRRERQPGTENEVSEEEEAEGNDFDNLEKSSRSQKGNGQAINETGEQGSFVPQPFSMAKRALRENVDFDEVGSAADKIETMENNSQFKDVKVIKGINENLSGGNRRHSIAQETGLKAFQRSPKKPSKSPTKGKDSTTKKRQPKGDPPGKTAQGNDFTLQITDEDGRAKEIRADTPDSDWKRSNFDKSSSPSNKIKRGKVPPIKLHTQPQLSVTPPPDKSQQISQQSKWAPRGPVGHPEISTEEVKDSLMKLSSFVKKGEKKVKVQEPEGVGNEEEKEFVRNSEEEEEGEEDEDEVKFHIMQMIKMLKVENAKSEFYREKNHVYYELLISFLSFTKKLFDLISSSLKMSNPLLYEELHKEYMDLRRRLPKDIDPSFEIENQEHERQSTLREKIKKTAKLTKFLMNQPKLGIIKEKTVDRMNHPGWVLINKLKDKQFSKQIKGLLTMKNLMKTITLLYDEKITMSKESSMLKEQDMPIFIFNHLLNKYGIKRVAEQKFSFLVLSVKVHVQNFRVNVFGRMLNIFDQNLNFSIDEVKKFIEGIDYLVYQCTMGYTVVHLETDARRMVPYIRALDYLRFFGENRLNQEEITELRREMESLKEVDPKNQNKTGIIDMDIFLLKMITKYRAVMNRTKEHVVTAFKAADLDGNKTCSLKEFVLLYRHIEPEKFNEEAVIKIFEEQCDIITDNETSMSFDKFTAVCVEYGLFSSAAQDKFINVKSEKEINESFGKLKAEWEAQKLKIIEKMKHVEGFVSSDDMENWATILEVLDMRVKKESIIEKKPVLIAFRIMNDELSRTIEEKEKQSEESSEGQLSELDLSLKNS